MFDSNSETRTEVNAPTPSKRRNNWEQSPILPALHSKQETTSVLAPRQPFCTVGGREWGTGGAGVMMETTVAAASGADLVLICMQS